MVNAQRRKELQQQFKEYKTPMGLYAIHCLPSDQYYLGISQNVPALLNRVLFELKGGWHKNKNLQKEWEIYGESGFEMKLLEELPYSKDETKTDYLEELEILREVWHEKLEKWEDLL